MGFMFDGCRSLSAIDVRSFDTSKVTSMRNLFSNCEKLESIGLSSFNTEKVRDMSRMFSWCWELTSLDISNFDTGNVMDMSKMFSGCMKLSSLNLGTFDMTKVKGTEDMFRHGNENIEIYLSVDSPSVEKILGQLKEDGKLNAKVHVGGKTYRYNTVMSAWQY